MLSVVKLPWTLIKNLKLPRRNFAQTQYNYRNKKDWMLIIQKLAFEWSRYNRYGLYSHDVIDYNDPIIREALRRLPEDVLDARNFRIMRAMQLDFLKIRLPREEWITYEQDLKYRYLSPYIMEINAERTEIYQFGYRNYSDSDWPADEVK